MNQLWSGWQSFSKSYQRQDRRWEPWRGNEREWINMNKRHSRLSMLGKVNTGPCNHGKSVWGGQRSRLCPRSRSQQTPRKKQLTLLRGVKEESVAALFTWRSVKHRRVYPVSGWVKLCKLSAYDSWKEFRITNVKTTLMALSEVCFAR